MDIRADTDAGAIIRQMRAAMRLSQEDLAQAVGTTQQTIDRIERGQTKHSRYVQPAMAWLGARLEGRLNDAADFGQSVGQTPTVAFTRTIKLLNPIMDGNIYHQSNIACPAPLITAKDPYGYVVREPVKGPQGDWVFYPNSIVFADPDSAPKHMDWGIARKAGEDARIAVFADAASLPAQIEPDQMRKWGYVMAGDYDTFDPIKVHYLK